MSAAASSMYIQNGSSCWQGMDVQNLIQDKALPWKCTSTNVWNCTRYILSFCTKAKSDPWLGWISLPHTMCQGGHIVTSQLCVLALPLTPHSSQKPPPELLSCVVSVHKRQSWQDTEMQVQEFCCWRSLAAPASLNTEAGKLHCKISVFWSMEQFALGAAKPQGFADGHFLLLEQ